MMLTAVFAMLSTGEVFNPCDLYKIDMPETLKAKQVEKALKQAIRLIQSQGLAVVA
jgi:hypothetical protein